jgi:hypothetical protein
MVGELLVEHMNLWEFECFLLINPCSVDSVPFHVVLYVEMVDIDWSLMFQKLCLDVNYPIVWPVV